MKSWELFLHRSPQTAAQGSHVDAQSLKALVELRAAKAECGRHLWNAAPRFAEKEFEILALERLLKLVERSTAELVIPIGRATSFWGEQAFEGRSVNAFNASRVQKHPDNQRSQLSDVTAPGVLGEDEQGPRRDVGRIALQSSSLQTKEMLEEERDVGGPISKRRNPDHEATEAVEEVVAQLALVEGRCRVEAGDTQEAHIDLPCPQASERTHEPRLDKMQKLRLNGKRTVQYLIEEQRPAVELFKDPRAGLLGAAECARLVAEELRLEELRGKRCAVKRKKGPVVPGAGLMNGAGDQVLADSRFSMNPYRSLKSSQARNRLDQPPHRFGSSDDAVERELAGPQRGRWFLLCGPELIPKLPEPREPRMRPEGLPPRPGKGSNQNFLRLKASVQVVSRLFPLRAPLSQAGAEKFQLPVEFQERAAQDSRRSQAERFGAWREIAKVEASPRVSERLHDREEGIVARRVSIDLHDQSSHSGLVPGIDLVLQQAQERQAHAVRDSQLLEHRQRVPKKFAGVEDLGKGRSRAEGTGEVIVVPGLDVAESGSRQILKRACRLSCQLDLARQGGHQEQPAGGHAPDEVRVIAVCRDQSSQYSGGRCVVGPVNVSFREVERRERREVRVADLPCVTHGIVQALHGVVHVAEKVISNRTRKKERELQP